MKVFKFGGASVKDASAIRNVAEVLQRYDKDKRVVVVSAMGKTTNALEVLHGDWYLGRSTESAWQTVYNYHLQMSDEVLGYMAPALKTALNELKDIIDSKPEPDFDKGYDAVVACGELMSTALVAEYLEFLGKKVFLANARNFIHTNNQYREGKVDWSKSAQSSVALKNEMETSDIIVVQGFIGLSEEGKTITLGREGSDFTAAILAFLLEAESVTIWKDVPGMMNADPRRFPNAVILKKISYREAIELAYFGASVIHPKTIKPLQNKNIPLYVKSFIRPDESGTVIQNEMKWDHLITGFIFKEDQVLISITPRDFSFVVEENLMEIFEFLAESSIRINLMENSAISFSICVDNNQRRINHLRELLSEQYEVRYNEKVSLLTIRHGNQSTIEDLTRGHEILIEQLSRSTARLVLR
ncbi:MAG: aspartate kinase [Flavobacteriales bacterium]|nr:aspartate kinase [Flavobacteriales bacterium]